MPPDAFDLPRSLSGREVWGEQGSNSFNLQERLGVVSADGLSFEASLEFIQNLNFDKVQNP